MSLCERIANQVQILEGLEQQMADLAALRRALCLAHASRYQSKGHRRRPEKASAWSARRRKPWTPIRSMSHLG